MLLRCLNNYQKYLQYVLQDTYNVYTRRTYYFRENLYLTFRPSNKRKVLQYSTLYIYIVWYMSIAKQRLDKHLAKETDAG
jgi:hypothetical protein